MTQNQNQPDESGYAFSNEEIEKALLSGEHADVLEDYFGKESYDALKELSLAAAAAILDGPRVLILPGFMGSNLGRQKNDMIWLNPVALSSWGGAHITDLAMPNQQQVLGVLAFPVPPKYVPPYAEIMLKLKTAKFKAEFYPFDWRKSISELGEDLNTYLETLKDEDISLVCHSMGGMVARVALNKSSSGKVNRMIMLGTPNFGSFETPQGIRGVSCTLRGIHEKLTPQTPDDIARKVVCTLPGMYDMMPAPEVYTKVDLYDREQWPDDSHPRPHQDLLNGVASDRQNMANADKRFSLIAGVNQLTTTDLEKDKGQFVYTQTYDGDGTVPLGFAKLPGAKTYYVEEKHMLLPSNDTVIGAVIDIINTGTTAKLSVDWSPPPYSKRVTESELCPDLDKAQTTELGEPHMREIGGAVFLGR